ncbi:MAG: hypothetical protein ACFFHD_08295 [Promethearchaeota archaeon]
MVKVKRKVSLRHILILSAYSLILFLSYSNFARAIDTMTHGTPLTPLEIEYWKECNSTILTWGWGPGEVTEEILEAWAELDDMGIKIHYPVHFRIEYYTQLDFFYNITVRLEHEDVIDYHFDVFTPTFPAEKLWAISLGDEEYGFYGLDEMYQNVPEHIGKYNNTYEIETGYYLKPINNMNQTENLVFIEWMNEKSVWMFNYLYDHIKARLPNLVIFQTIFMPPAWGLRDEFTAAYEIKTDAWFVDCYYAAEYPWLLYETNRRYKSSMPDKDFCSVLWGTIWDFINKAGDNETYLDGSFEQIRREAWISYLSGADIISWFDWGPQDPYGWDWRMGFQRTDQLGRQIFKYRGLLNQELAKLPVLRSKPQVLFIGSGFSTELPMPNYAQAGLFSEYDAVNQRCFAKTNLNLSQYKLIIMHEDRYYEETVSKLNEYVESGGHLIFLGGTGLLNNIYGNATRINLFPIERKTTQSYYIGDIDFKIKINATTPNLLNLDLDYDEHYHDAVGLQNESFTDDYHFIGDLCIIDNETVLSIDAEPLFLYNNKSIPNSGWILYYGAKRLSSNPADYYQDDEIDLYFFYREVLRAFSNFLNITGSITTENNEDLLITQGKLEDGSILAGISNFYNENRSVNYSLDLNRFNLPDGNYWVHSLDTNASLGQFSSNNSILTFSLDIVANGTRLLLISQEKPNPGYSIEIFPEIPITEEKILPIIIIHSPLENETFGKIAPDFKISLIEEALNSTWYTIEGVATDFYFTELNGSIDQDAWNNLPEGEITLTFYARDAAGNIGTEYVIVIKSIPEPTPSIPGYDLFLLSSIIGIVSIIVLKRLKKS